MRKSSKAWIMPMAVIVAASMAATGARQEPPVPAAVSAPVSAGMPATETPEACATSAPQADREALAGKMVTSLKSSPVLHMSVRFQDGDRVYQAESWMTESKVRGQVSYEGKLVFARFFEAGRVQEFASSVTFKNGTEAKDALIEYRTDPVSGFDEWPRLIEQAFACGPGCVATDSWLRNTPNPVPGMLADLVRSGSVSESTLNGKACFRIQIEGRPGPTTVLTKELYLDRETCEPLRQRSLNTRDGKVVKDTVIDYRFEHLSKEDGIAWELTPATLK